MGESVARPRRRGRALDDHVMRQQPDLSPDVDLLGAVELRSLRAEVLMRERRGQAQLCTARGISKEPGNLRLVL